MSTYLTPITSYSGPDGTIYTQTWGTSSDETNIIAHLLNDDGTGNLPGTFGTISYGSQTVNLQVAQLASYNNYSSPYEDAAAFAAAAGGGVTPPGALINSHGYYNSSDREELLAGSAIVVSYLVGSPTPVARSMAVPVPAMVIDLAPYTSDRIVPGSVRFTWMGTTYEDLEGRIYRDGLGGAGIESGRIDYATGVVTMHDYIVGANPDTVTLQSLWTQKSDWTTASVFFMTDASPIQPGQITITVTDVHGDLISVSCDLHGNLTGDHAHGYFEFQNGLGELQFGDFVLDDALSPEEKQEWWYNPADVGAVEPDKIWRPWPVDPASLRYNAVSNFYLPIDPNILGLDPVRLPQDGRVPIFKKGRVLILGHNDQLAPATYSNSQTVSLGRERVSHVWLIDDDGELIADGWEADEDDLDNGQVRIIDTSGWAQPVTIEHRVQDMMLCTDVQIDGTISVNIPVSHNYPPGSVLSSALLFGDKFARALPTFTQQSWDGITWADTTQGNPAVANYNEAAYPIEVTNAGALTERYALRIRSDATTFDLIAEHLGQIASGTINADFEPNNPFDPSKKLFRIRAAGWGSGWVAGNVLFIHTEGAMSPMACIRTVQPGVPTSSNYTFDLLTGGDIDRPPHAPAP